MELEKINKLVMGRGGTGNKSNFGASTILEVSLAAFKAEAAVTWIVALSAHGRVEVTAQCQLSG